MYSSLEKRQEKKKDKQMELNVGAFSDTDLYTREIADVFWSLKEQHSLIF